MAQRLRDQADTCERLGSPLYAALLARAANELAEGEIMWTVLQGHEEDPADSALALRLMGAVHRLVLGGDAPELAAHYPSTGGRPQDPWPAFRAVFDRYRYELGESTWARVTPRSGCQRAPAVVPRQARWRESCHATAATPVHSTPPPRKAG